MQNNIYQIVTERILDKLKSGVTPWKRPWKVGGARPRNLETKKYYRGFNSLALSVCDFQSPFFGTYDQIARLGGNVRRGEKGTPVLFFKFNDQSKTEPSDTEEASRVKTPFIVRYYNVFNLSQTEGLIGFEMEVEKSSLDLSRQTFSSIEDKILASYQKHPKISYGFNKACYLLHSDEIQMPDPLSFKVLSSYASTFFHELIHSTGAAHRLNRMNLKSFSGFGTHEYSKEELVAELGSSFLLSELGIENDLNDNASYINGWYEVLSRDPRLIVKAASAAEKAVEYILKN